jgi:hypothetical protein
MSELPRRIVSHLRRYIGNRRRQKRARTRLAFTLTLSDPRTTSNGSRRLPSIQGHTSDISTTGIGLIVPAIRIGEHYLVGEERSLHVSLQLPDGPVELKVVPVRYESLEEDAEDTGYVIGAKVIEMTAQGRERFNEYVGTVLSKQGGD